MDRRFVKSLIGGNDKDVNDVGVGGVDYNYESTCEEYADLRNGFGGENNVGEEVKVVVSGGGPYGLKSAYETFRKSSGSGAEFNKRNSLVNSAVGPVSSTCSKANSFNGKILGRYTAAVRNMVNSENMSKHVNCRSIGVI